MTEPLLSFNIDLADEKEKNYLEDKLRNGSELLVFDVSDEGYPLEAYLCENGIEEYKDQLEEQGLELIRGEGGY